MWGRRTPRLSVAESIYQYGNAAASDVYNVFFIESRRTQRVRESMEKVCSGEGDYRKGGWRRSFRGNRSADIPGGAGSVRHLRHTRPCASTSPTSRTPLSPTHRLTHRLFISLILIPNLCSECRCVTPAAMMWQTKS